MKEQCHNFRYTSTLPQRRDKHSKTLVKANKWTTFQPKNVGGKSVYIAMAKLCDK